MESKHTPGPWMVDEGGLNVENSNGDPVAACGAVRGSKDIENNESKANAALIAAAPDMYEALRAAYADLELWGAHKPITHTMELANAALAKAEGR